MYKELANIVYDYKTNNKDIDKDFYLNSAEIIADGLNVKDCVKDIRFSENKKIMLGYYKIDEEILYVCPNNVQTKVDKGIYKYINEILTLFHELDHASIKKECKTGSDEIIHRLFYYTNRLLNEKYNAIDTKDIKMKDLFILIKYLLTYYGNHDLAPFERRANLNSTNNAKKVLAELVQTDLDEKETTNSYLYMANMYDRHLLNNYKKNKNGLTNSPSYDYCNKLKSIIGFIPEEVELYNKSKEESFKIDSTNYDLDKRALYGLQLTNEELNALDDNRFEKRIARSTVQSK